MVAHNNDHDRDVFQISPGHGPRVDVAGLPGPPGQRDLERLGARVEPAAGAPRLRPRPAQSRRRHASRQSPRTRTCTARCGRPIDPRSTLYNTDGQIFSDAGVPVVLFMENYDINRTGYHDSHDTMANIDLDYGAAVAAIAIEAVARAATEKAPGI